MAGESTEEAGERIAREAMEDGGEVAGREAGEEVGKKAAQLPTAMAAAKFICETNDLNGRAVTLLLGQLLALKSRFRWIIDFVAKKKTLGHYLILMIASKHKVASDYTTKDAAKQDKNVKDSVTTGREHEIEDPGLLDFIIRLEAAGIKVKNFNINVMKPGGAERFTEIDVITDKALIQFKNGASSAKVITEQLDKTEAITDWPVVTFVNVTHNRGNKVVSTAGRHGYYVTNNFDDLVSFLK